MIPNPPTGQEIILREISRNNLHEAGKCNGTFTVESTLILSFQNGPIQFTLDPVPTYQKRYPVETIDDRAYIDHPDRIIYLAYSDQAVAGEIRLRKNWNGFASIEDIVVDAGFRRRGIGRQLLEKAVQWVKEGGLPGIMPETHNNNVAACLF